MRLRKQGLDLGLVLIGWESEDASLYIHPLREQQCKTMTFDISLKGRFRSYEVCLRLSNVIACNSKHSIQDWSFATFRGPAIIVGFQNAFQNLNNLRVFACYARRFIGLICPKHFLSCFVFCIPVCFTISCNAHFKL